MGKILRNPTAAAKEKYDLVIIGGGIYGVMLSLEASKRRLRSLLIERDDFGGATTFNSLRIIHGGLRYLQGLDLHRFWEYVGERRWFLHNFPQLVKPLPFIMPVYGNGLRRPSIFQVALWANDLLSCRRNKGIDPDRHLPGGEIVSPDKTREIFPMVDSKGLQGGAIWYDACVPDSQRLVIELLRYACTLGATALNYLEAKELVKINESVGGIIAVDRESGNYYEYRACVVINSAGPWCRELASRFDRDEPRLFRSSLAWNLLLNRKPLSSFAIAVAPKTSTAQTYFLLPWKGRLLAGTGHAPWNNSEYNAKPTRDQQVDFLNELNLAVPGLEVNPDDVLRVFSGLLPARKPGSVDLTNREVILSHEDNGGPKGLYSVSGVKFTTSRRVAEKTLEKIFPHRKVSADDLKDNNRPSEDGETSRGILDPALCTSFANDKFKQTLLSLIREESVVRLEDLIFRRTNLWENPDAALDAAPVICQFFQWDDVRCRDEIERLRNKFNQVEN